MGSASEGLLSSWVQHADVAKVSAKGGFDRIRQGGVGDDQFVGQVEDAHLSVIEFQQEANLRLDPIAI